MKHLADPEKRCCSSTNLTRIHSTSSYPFFYTYLYYFSC